MKHVFSTLNVDVSYPVWDTQPGVSTVQRQVLVRGGAGVASPVSGGPRIYTPQGVRTEVSDEDAEFLASHELFKFHQERGHVKIESIAKDADTVAQKMEVDTGGKPVDAAFVAKEAAAAAAKGALAPGETLQVVVNKGK